MHRHATRTFLTLLAIVSFGDVQAGDIIPGVGPVARRSPADQRIIVYRVYLKDGTMRESSKLPLLAFDSVVFQQPGGAGQSLRLDLVDLSRSEASWDETLIWDLLDRSPYVGQKLPPISLVIAGGAPHTLQPTRWTFVDLYRSYCQPCHKSLAAVQAWLQVEPRGIDVVAVCVDCKGKQLESIVNERQLGGVGNWTNARFDHEPAWLESAMGTSSSMSFLVDAASVVRHANMRPRRKDYFPVALDRVWTEEIKSKGVTP